MKLKLLAFFFLFTGTCYLLQTLELDSNEVKKNYENEFHAFDSSVKSTFNFSFLLDKAIDLPIIFNDLIFQCDSYRQQPLFCLFKEPSPPDKIYISQQSLLI